MEQKPWHYGVRRGFLFPSFATFCPKSVWLPYRICYLLSIPFLDFCSDLRDKSTVMDVAPELYVVLGPELELMVVLFLIWWLYRERLASTDWPHFYKISLWAVSYMYVYMMSVPTGLGGHICVYVCTSSLKQASHITVSIEKHFLMVHNDKCYCL